MTRHYATTTEARSHFRALLDCAFEGRVVTVQRESERFVVVEIDRQVRRLMRARPAEAVVVREGGGWAAMLPGLPIHGEGDTFDEAIGDLLVAIRDYAEDWNDHLLKADNHRENWDVAQIGELATDAQLRAWILEPEALTA